MGSLYCHSTIERWLEFRRGRQAEWPRFLRLIERTDLAETAKRRACRVRSALIAAVACRLFGEGDGVATSSDQYAGEQYSAAYDL
jgi:hypothetical protein